MNLGSILSAALGFRWSFLILQISDMRDISRHCFIVFTRPALPSLPRRLPSPSVVSRWARQRPALPASHCGQKCAKLPVQFMKRTTAALSCHVRPAPFYPPMDEKSRASDGAGATLYTFLQMIMRYTFARTTVLLLAFASVSFGRMCCVVRELDYQFSVVWLHRKWLRIRRVTASAVMALYIVFVPLCANGQVCQSAYPLLIHGQCFHFSDEHVRVSILCCMLLDVIMLKRYLSLE